MLLWVSQLNITSASCYQSHASCWSQCFLYISSKVMNVRICYDCVCCFLEVSYPSLLQPVLYVSQAGYRSLRYHGFIHAAACMLGADSRNEKKSLVSYVLVDMERFPFEGGTGEWR